MIKCFQILINQVVLNTHSVMLVHVRKFRYICMTGHSFPAEPKAEGFHKFNQEIRSIYRLNIIVICGICGFQDSFFKYLDIINSVKNTSSKPC